MKALRNSLNSFGSWLATASASSVSVLVCCVVGLSCSPTASADSITAPPASTPASLVAAVEAVLTVQERDAWVVQDYTDYAAAYTNLLNQLAALSFELDPTRPESTVHFLLDSISQLEADPQISGNPALLSIVQSMGASVGGGLAYWAYHAVQVCTSNAVAIDTEIQSTRVIDSATMTLEHGELPQGGDCSCPDYSSVLGAIHSALLDIYDCVADCTDTLYGIASGLGINVSGGLIYLGADIGRRLSMLRGVFDNAVEAQSVVDAWVGSDMTAEDALGWRLGVLVDGLSRMVSKSEYDAEVGSNSWQIVEQWRDFFISRYVFPTNTSDSALWVRYSDVGLDDLGAAIADALQGLEVTFDDPVDVRVVNTDPIDVRVVNSNLTVHVAPMTRDDINVEVNNTIEVVNQLEGEAAEYDSIDEEVSDYHTMFDFKDTVKSYAGKWQDMWSDLSIQYPESLPVWQGFKPPKFSAPDWGDNTQHDELIEVTSGYWLPGAFERRVFDGCRAVMRTLWTLVLLYVIAKLVKLDFLICRAMILIMFAIMGALGVGGMQKISWGDAFDSIMHALSDMYTGLFGGARED